MKELFYTKKPDSDNIYVIKSLIMEENENAIFLKNLDNALIGGFLNSHKNIVPVYSKYVIIEELCKKNKKGPCVMMGKMEDILKEYKMGENSPIIVDIMIDAEIEMDKKGIKDVHKKIKNIRYIEL